MRGTVFALAVLAMVLAAAPMFGYVYFNSDFNSDTLADPAAGTYPVPRNWVAGSGLTAAMCPDRFCVVDAYAEFFAYEEFGRVFRIHDPDGTYVGYPAAISRPFPVTASGTVTLTFDVLFSGTGTALSVRLCSEATVTTAASWATALIFEGAEPWGDPGISGNISYLSFYDTAAAANSVYNKIPDAIYDALQWYTVRIEADCNTKKWRAFLGSKGTDPLPLLLDWTDFVYSGPGQPGTQAATTLAQAFFWTSSKAGNEADGFFYIDNVKVEGPVAPQSFTTIQDARLADKGAYVQLSDKVVTAGNDQLGANFFYIQDDTNGGAGIRVRYYDGTVHEGDRVDVTGVVAQLSDNGAAVLHNGEREILAAVVTVHPAHLPEVAPVAMRNSDVGGGWLGPTESVTGGPEPKLKGVWPCNSYGNPGATTFAKGTNTMNPLFNTGTLVKTCGVVTRLCAGETISYPDIYISDGSLPWDGCRMGTTTDPVTPFPPGIRVKIRDEVAAQLPTINIGDFVVVTGIAGACGNSDTTCFYGSSGIRNIRLIRTRKAGDIVKVSP